MIIECTNCNKKFNVNPDLIPPVGRQIQCGSCHFKWHYKIEKLDTSPLILEKSNNTENAKLNNDQDNNEDTSASDYAKINLEIFDKNKDDITIKKDKKEVKPKIEIKSDSVSKFFSYLLVLIISCIALIILIDTLRVPLVKIFPSLEIILFNLFETLKDINLFIKDLN